MSTFELDAKGMEVVPCDKCTGMDVELEKFSDKLTQLVKCKRCGRSSAEVDMDDPRHPITVWNDEMRKSIEKGVEALSEERKRALVKDFLSEPEGRAFVADIFDEDRVVRVNAELEEHYDDYGKVVTYRGVEVDKLSPKALMGALAIACENSREDLPDPFVFGR